MKSLVLVGFVLLLGGLLVGYYDQNAYSNAFLPYPNRLLPGPLGNADIAVFALAVVSFVLSRRRLTRSQKLRAYNRVSWAWRCLAQRRCNLRLYRDGFPVTLIRINTRRKGPFIKQNRKKSWSQDVL